MSLLLQILVSVPLQLVRKFQVIIKDFEMDFYRYKQSNRFRKKKCW